MTDDTKPTPLHPLICARCQRPIAIESAYYSEVLTPSGWVPAHLVCVMPTKEKP